MNQPFSDVVLMLGGNLKDTRQIFLNAISLLSEKDCEIRSVSSLYKSEPWGYTHQPVFLNQALVIATKMEPIELMSAIHEIENKLGRIRELKNGPRTIDIDIIFFGSVIVSEPELQIPHPRMHQRMFNLLPVQEIAPDWVHPVLLKTVSELLTLCNDPLEVCQLNS